jgi:hypothetical protein
LPFIGPFDSEEVENALAPLGAKDRKTFVRLLDQMVETIMPAEGRAVRCVPQLAAERKSGVANIRPALRCERRSPTRISGLVKVVQVEKGMPALSGQQRYRAV